MADKAVSTEIWRPVAGYEGIYEVSSRGRVRSLDRESRCIMGGRPVAKRLRGKVLRQFSDKNGYPQVGLCGRTESVHRIVCRAFHGPKPSEGHEVAHRDGDKHNNRPSNLRWATDKENSADRLRHGTHCVGEAHPHAKLSDSQVLEIRRRFKRGERFASLARAFDLSPGHARDIALGNKRKWVE